MSQTISYTYDSPPFPGWSGTLVRSTDSAFIPCDLDNSDYQAFLTWISAGNPAPSGWTGPKNP